LPWLAGYSHSCVRNHRKLLKLTLASWNVRTLLDPTTSASERTERRTALVARELARYPLDIETLSETCFPNKGQLTEIGCGYTFFWSGHSSEDRPEAGVGYSIKNHLAKKLYSIPEGLNDRLMKLKFPWAGGDPLPSSTPSLRP